jgi:hypothetical protein
MWESVIVRGAREGHVIRDTGAFKDVIGDILFLKLDVGFNF